MLYIFRIVFLMRFSFDVQLISYTWSVHSFDGDYSSIPKFTGSCGYLFHEIPSIKNSRRAFLIFCQLFAQKRVLKIEIQKMLGQINSILPRIPKNKNYLFAQKRVLKIEIQKNGCTINSILIRIQKGKNICNRFTRSMG